MLLLAVLFVLCLCGHALGAEKTDIIVLKNGDRITGEIRSLVNGLLTYKTDDMGTLSVEWERIVRISSEWPFILEDVGGTRHIGALRETPEPGRVMIVTDSGPVTLDLVDIVGIARFGKRILQRFQGYLDAAFSLQKAQKERTLNVSTEIDYISQKWDIRSTGSSYVSAQENVPDTTKNVLTTDVMRVFAKRWSVAALAQVEQNTELNLNLRLLGGLGVGRYFVRTNRHVLTAIVGADVTRENYYGDTASKTGAEGVLGLKYQAFRYIFPNMSVLAGAHAYPSLTTHGRVRLNFQASVRYELFRRFYVMIGFVDNYDSKPGGETTTKNDYGMNLGISWSLN